MTFNTLLVGEGTLLILCAQILLRHGHAIEAIVATSQAIQEWAREQEIRCVSRLDALPAAMDGRPVDYLFSIANLFVVPPGILALPRLGAVNFHDGPLPRYAGLHATTWAILNQETSHGVTWHEMREAVDAGGILQQRLFALDPDETAFTLNRKCFTAGIESFEELIKDLGAGVIRSRPQEPAERTYFGKAHAAPGPGVHRLDAARREDRRARALPRLRARTRTPWRCRRSSSEVARCSCRGWRCSRPAPRARRARCSTSTGMPCASPPGPGRC